MIGAEAGAADLIAIALKTFRDEVLPGVPAEARLTALMLANALGIAERELRTRAAVAGGLVPPLRHALGDDPGRPLPHADPGTALDDLLQRLCAAIEAGAFDAAGEQRERLRDALWRLTRARLSVSNPKRLPAPPG